MDIQRKAFEAEFKKTDFYKMNLVNCFCFITDRYVWDEVQAAWEMWQAAKAQAVQEIQQALNDRLLVKSIREHVESHISEISVNDLFDKGWLAAMKCIQNNIDMLEAQEPANDPHPPKCNHRSGINDCPADWLHLQQCRTSS